MLVSQIMIPESPGLNDMLGNQLIVAIPEGDTEPEPVPLFLNKKYHPELTEFPVGTVIVAAPPVHT